MKKIKTLFQNKEKNWKSFMLVASFKLPEEASMKFITRNEYLVVSSFWIVISFHHYYYLANGKLKIYLYKI